MSESDVQQPSTAKKIARSPGAFLGLGVLACAACCAIPIVVGMGVGGAALTAIGAYAESIGAVFLGLGVLGFVGNLLRKRYAQRQAPACSIDCASKHTHRA